MLLIFLNVPTVCQTVILSLLFGLLTGELLLLIYKLFHSSPVRLCLGTGVLIAVNLVMLIILAGVHDNVLEVSMCNYLPWMFVVVLLLLSLSHLVMSFLKERKRSQKCLSPVSIYETVNDLPMGLLFVNPEGRIILCNNKMREIAYQLTGGYPQMLEELMESIKAPKEGINILPDDCLEFENGGIYNFQLAELAVEKRAGWRQLTAVDVTEQYHINEQLKINNEKLKKTNEQLKEMYERMGEDIREKESLELKVYIHDTIGRSLISIQDIMDSSEITEQKLCELHKAVSVLSDNRRVFDDTMDEVRRTALKMGVDVNVEGYIPSGTQVEKLIVTATRECVTNGLRHAGCSEITVVVQESEGIYKVTIKNNGERPKGKITEGSGLSGLRHIIENSGGEMHISHYPDFALVLKLHVLSESFV